MEFRFSQIEMKEYLEKLGYSFQLLEFRLEGLVDPIVSIKIAYLELPDKLDYHTCYREHSIERVFYKEIKKKLLEL